MANIFGQESGEAHRGRKSRAVREIMKEKMNKENSDADQLPLSWQKGKIIAEMLGLILIPILIFTLSFKNTRELKQRDERHANELKKRDEDFMKEIKERERAERKAEIDKEIGVRYVEISVAILRENPSQQTKELREWAIATFKKYSPIPLTDKFIEELRQKPLSATVKVEGIGMKTYLGQPTIRVTP